MKNLYYAMTIFLIFLIIHECYLACIPVKEGLNDKDAELWKNNHHNVNVLDRELNDLEELTYIRTNNPSLLGGRVNDKSFTIIDVVKYFKSGISDNTAQLESIAIRLASAIPDPDTIHITGI